MYYKTEVLQLPEGMGDWVSTGIYSFLTCFVDGVYRWSTQFKLIKKQAMTG